MAPTRIIALAFWALLYLFGIDRSAGDSATFQFCWALGALDKTAYIAEAEGADDRRSSFADLIEVSGIDHRDLQCHTMAMLSYRAFRDGIVAQWKKDGLEIVNTTFLSDLDY